MLQNLCPKLSYCFYMWRMWFSFYMMLMGMQHLLGALEAFCLTNGLIVNVTVQRHWYPTVTYKGEHKYLVIDVPTTNKCSICFKLVGNIISCWRINATKVILMEGKWNKCYLIQCLRQVLLYEVEVQGGTIPSNAWNEIKKIQKMFSRRQLGDKFTTYQVMVLETSVWRIETMAL